jgi:hypothetical protein
LIPGRLITDRLIVRFRIKGQVLINLYPAKDGFVAQVNLSEAAVQQALSGGLRQHAKQAIAAAHPYPEGRWLFVRVDSVEDALDIQRLLAVRVEEKRL